MQMPTPEELRAIRKARVLKEMRELIEELKTPTDEEAKNPKK